jgi:FtsP/CotA-like multicopper oxidase with cupredoxin domain
MPRFTALTLASLALGLACGPTPDPAPLPIAELHDNTIPAGRRVADTVRIRLEPVPAGWYPETPTGPGARVWAFRADSGRPMIPGPLLRAPTGTIFRVTVINPDRRTALRVVGLGRRPLRLTDTLRVPPGDSVTVSFDGGEPGSYYYAASWAPPTEHMPADQMLLAGALIVDPPTGATPDQVFVTSSWFTPIDSTLGAPFVTRDWLVINGRSFPHNGTLQLRQGDTVRWRWINPSPDAHPIHLHGDFFRVERVGTWAADSATWGQEVVTQLMLPGSTFMASYAPQEPGHWLLHCHFAFHTSGFLSTERIANLEDPGAPTMAHDMTAMRGMVLRIAVTPRPGGPRRDVDSVHARPIRLVATSRFGVYGNRPSTAAPGYTEGFAYVLGDPARDSFPTQSATLVLQRGEPVAITIVNHLRAPTAVHWHGLEVPSWSDGVPGWAGGLPTTAPAIAPGDSFTARFTPTRPGTYIYHSHANESHQINGGLYGALLVVDSASYHPERERLVVIGGDGERFQRANVNGSQTPAPLDIPTGMPIRLRLVSIAADWRVRVSLRGPRGAVPWTMLAKDAADIPPERQSTAATAWRAGPGETADFVVTLTEAGAYQLIVQGDVDDWQVTVPVRVTRAGGEAD